MKHRFYQKSKSERTQIQLVIGVASFIVILIAAIISWVTGIYILVLVIFPITLSIIAPFFDVPSLRKSGSLIYYSPLLLAEKPKNNRIIIHGGTLFDYVFVIDQKMTGKQRTNFIIQQYLEGLLNLIEEKATKSDYNPTIRGTSYIINQSTAQRIGFEVIKTDNLQKLILLYNYFNILTAYSIAKGKLSFPKLGATKTFETKLDELAKRKDFIIELNERLKASSPRSVSTDPPPKNTP